jgi:hypothetical protein
MLKLISQCTLLRWPIRVIQAQKVKSPHNNTKHANKCAIRATSLRFTPQFHATKKPLTDHGLNIIKFTSRAFSRDRMAIKMVLVFIYITNTALLIELKQLGQLSYCYLH